MQDRPFGQLTVQCFFKENTLEVEILSARNLLPMNSDGTCDPFVKLHFWPEEKFTNVTKPKTNSQSKTLFPLFEERFVM
jgi:BAI1-associated protein 3